MLTRQTRSLIVTPSPTRAERAQMKEYDNLPGGDSDARRAQLAAALGVGQTRITVGALNTLMYGRYEANRRAVAAWVEAQTGKPWPAIPAFLGEQAARAAALAGYPGFAPDACLINRYQPGARMGLHRDQDEHDFAAPIVSVSLGLPCRFLWGGLTRQSPTRRLALTHGDVLVWGGPSRLVFHGVAPLREGQHPLLGNERWNLTFRMAKARYPAGQPSE